MMENQLITVKVAKRNERGRLCSIKEVMKELRENVELALLGKGLPVSTSLGFHSANNLSLKGKEPYIVSYYVKKEDSTNGRAKSHN
jgi:hypothetical protein